jgi:hypothetical protein
MTKFCGFNGFGDSAGDSMTGQGTTWKGRGVLPAGKLKNVPSDVANISGSSRRMAKAKVGSGGGLGTHYRGPNALSRGNK